MDGGAIRGTWFGPWPKTLCDGDLWGYGEAMKYVRERAVELEVFEENA